MSILHFSEADDDSELAERISPDQKPELYSFASKERQNAAPHHPNSRCEIFFRMPPPNDQSEKWMTLTEEQAQGAAVAIWAFSKYIIRGPDRPGNTRHSRAEKPDRIFNKEDMIAMGEKMHGSNPESWAVTEDQVDYYKFILRSSLGDTKDAPRTRRYTAEIVEATQADGLRHIATYQFETLAFIDMFKMVMGWHGKNPRNYLGSVRDHSENEEGVDISSCLV